MKISGFLILYLLSIILVGCKSPLPAVQLQSESTLESSQTTLTARITPFPTLRLDFTPTSTSTLAPTHTPIPTITSTQTAPGYVQKCLTIEESWPEGFQIEGKLIRYCAQGVCALSFNEQIPQDKIIAPYMYRYFQDFVSPDRNKMAYLRVARDLSGKPSDRNLYIVNSDGKEIISGLWLADWWLDGWRDNETLNLDRWEGEQHFVSVYDLKTQEVETATLLPPLKNPYPGDILVTDARENYHTTYDRVAYLYIDSRDSYVYYALWDVWANEILWQRQAGGEVLFGSQWSPDGQHVVVAGGENFYHSEFFMVSRDGLERQLTNLNAAHPGMNITIGEFDWSPDGQFIALWLNIRKGQYYGEWSFAVLNLETGELVDYCLQSDPSKYPHSIWSPDSQQVALQIYESENLSEPSIVLLDFWRNVAVRLPYYEGSLFGWMK